MSTVVGLKKEERLGHLIQPRCFVTVVLLFHRLLGIISHALKVDDDHWLIPDNPCIMPRGKE